MLSINQILFLQHTYGVAAEYLMKIASHPTHVEQGHLGYFMTIDNIEEVVKSLNPEDWYKGENYENKEVTFEDLPVEDRWKVEEAINDLKVRSMSQNHLIDKCNKCRGLSLEFGDKILKLAVEKNNIRKKLL